MVIVIITVMFLFVSIISESWSYLVFVLLVLLLVVFFCSSYPPCSSCFHDSIFGYSWCWRKCSFFFGGRIEQPFQFRALLLWTFKSATAWVCACAIFGFGLWVGCAGVWEVVHADGFFPKTSSKLAEPLCAFVAAIFFQWKRGVSACRQCGDNVQRWHRDRVQGSRNLTSTKWSMEPQALDGAMMV